MDGFDISIYGTKENGLVTIKDVELVFELRHQYQSILNQLFLTSLAPLVKELRGQEHKINSVSLEYDSKGLLCYVSFITEDGDDCTVEYPTLTEMELFDLIRVMYIMICRDRLAKSATHAVLPYELPLQRTMLRHMLGDVIFLKSPDYMVRFDVSQGIEGLNVSTTLSLPENDDTIEIRGSPKLDYSNDPSALPHIVIV